MKEENRNYKKDDKKPKNDLIGLIMVIVGFICLGLVFYFIQQPKLSNTEETVSIQKYNAILLRTHYLSMENQVKNQLLYDIVMENELDTVFIESISNHVPAFILNPTNENLKIDGVVDKQLMAFQLDSLCANWYESIPFSIIDAEHDSTWVLNSDTYQSTMEAVNYLRNKWE